MIDAGVIRTRALVAALLCALLWGCAGDDNGGAQAQEPQQPSYGYSGDTGPGFWAEQTSDWQNCGTTNRQSPIDISGAVADGSLAPLVLDLHETPLKIFNNGHTIEQEYEAGSTLAFEGTTYTLRQFHFHTLAEHTVNGERAVMELHAVFGEAASGNIAVIGLLYDIGQENEFLSRFDQRLPAKDGDTIEDSGTELNLAEGLTDTAAYYTYPGSLTTPPCSPIVTWIVLKEHAEMSSDQFKAFRRILGNNFRPLQDLSGRTIRATP